MLFVNPCIPIISTNESERPILDSLETLHVVSRREMEGIKFLHMFIYKYLEVFCVHSIEGFFILLLFYKNRLLIYIS